MVTIKEYVRLTTHFDKFAVFITRSLPGGVSTQLLKREYDDKLQAQAYRAGVRDGINLARRNHA